MHTKVKLEKKLIKEQTNFFYSCKKTAFNKIVHGHPSCAFMKTAYYWF